MGYSQWAQCGLILVCIGYSPAVAIMIVQGCGTICWIDCFLMAAPIVALSVGMTAVFFGAGTNVSSTATSTIQETTKSAREQLVAKLGTWWIAAVCYLAAVGLGLWVILCDNRLTSTDMNSLGTSRSSRRRRGRRVPRGTLLNTANPPSSATVELRELSSSDEQSLGRRTSEEEAWSSGSSSGEDDEREKVTPFSLGRRQEKDSHLRDTRTRPKEVV